VVASDVNGIVLTVANDGPAIPEAERERIFEPFMRLDEARSLDIGGSGLGLAIARSIMTALGGSIVAAAVESGAEFRASFPAPVTN
jgi:signal transduction histidine kinase